MKKYKLKQWVKDLPELLLLSVGITVLVVTVLSCLSWSANQYDEKLIEEEMQKKTEMSRTHISQN